MPLNKVVDVRKFQDVRLRSCSVADDVDDVHQTADRPGGNAVVIHGQERAG